MKNDKTVSDLSEDGGDLYPHFKITVEEFPRVLATRVIEEDDAEYFGAFLSKTAVRILMDLLNRTFRLRTCEIAIDGNFPVPCTQFYRKRCLAPCVSNLCNKSEYLEMVELVRLFLANRRGEFVRRLTKRIEGASEELDFESAAKWRDILLSVEAFWQDPRLNVWLDDTVDTFDADETVAGNFVYLVSQRGRNVLGRKVFKLPKGGGIEPHEAIERIISSFYRFHLPKEIRVSLDFEGRKRLAAEFTERFGRQARIILTPPDRQRITAVRALRATWDENELEFLKEKATGRQISGELKRLFHLNKLPQSVEAFDVAHISGQSFASASSLWEDGKFVPEKYSFAPSNETSEPNVMAEAVRRRLMDSSDSRPDIILLDGGRSQLNACLKALKDVESPPKLVGAVKPAGQHSSVSHFLTDTVGKIVFESDNPAHAMLRLLRDAAHDLSNQVHRDLRDLRHHYELAAMLPSLTESERLKIVTKFGSVRKIREADPDSFGESDLALRLRSDIANAEDELDGVIPLIVPIRFQAEGGDADDLRPIEKR